MSWWFGWRERNPLLCVFRDRRGDHRFDIKNQKEESEILLEKEESEIQAKRFTVQTKSWTKGEVKNPVLYLVNDHHIFKNLPLVP